MLRWFPAENNWAGLVDLLPRWKPGNLKDKNESDEQQANVHRKSDSQSTDECFCRTELPKRTEEDRPDDRHPGGK